MKHNRKGSTLVEHAKNIRAGPVRNDVSSESYKKRPLQGYNTRALLPEAFTSFLNYLSLKSSPAYIQHHGYRNHYHLDSNFSLRHKTFPARVEHP